MAGKLKEAELTTRNARSKLDERAKPYWRRVDAEMHLGYRKGKRSGVWVVRWAVGAGNYRQETVGNADDVTSVGTLTYDQAVRHGVEIVEQARKDEATAAAGPIKTVESAVRSYIAERDARDSKRRGRDVKSDAHTRLTRHVLSHPIASKTLTELTTDDVTAWRAAVPGKETTRTRLWSDLRAALADAGCKITLPKRKADRDERVETAREGQILTDAQVAALVAKAAEQGEDFGRLIAVLAATGARLSQVVRLKVGDFQPALSRLSVPTSRKGDQSSKPASVNVKLGPDMVAVLTAITEGRRPGEPLLERDFAGNGRPLTRGAWKTASELTKPWAATLEAAGMKGSGVVVYALRHSSIVRSLKAALPTQYVAKQHDTSARMIELHYGKFVVDAFEDLADRAIIPLMPAKASNVHQLRKI